MEVEANYSTNVSNISRAWQSGNNETGVLPNDVSAEDFVEYRWSLWIQAAFGVFIVTVGIPGNSRFFYPNVQIRLCSFLSDKSIGHNLSQIQSTSFI